MSETHAENLVLLINQEVDIAAPREQVFQGLIDRLSHLNTGEGNAPLPMKLEAWPGGRWYRDLGDNSGHLWGFVQSIKPPALLEIWGPMFLSFAAVNTLIVRLEATGEGTRLKLRHQVFGAIPEEYREGMDEGWGTMLQDLKSSFEK